MNWYKYFLGKCIHDISPPYAEEETAAKAVWEICADEDTQEKMSLKYLLKMQSSN